MKYKYKLIFYFSCVVLIPVLISSYLAAVYIKKGFVYEIDMRLKETAAGINENFKSLQDNMFLKLNLIAVDDAAAEYKRTGNRNELIAKIKTFYNAADFDVFEIGDSDGKVILRAHNPDIWGESKADYKLISNALLGFQGVDFEPGLGGIGIRAVRPLKAEGEIIGTLMIGYWLDDEMAAKNKRLTGVDIGFYFDKGEYNSTLEGFENIAAAYFSTAKEKSVYLMEFAIDKKDYRAALKAIYQKDGSFLGVILAAKDMDEISSVYNDILKVLFINVFLGIIVAVIIIVFMSREFSKPVEALRKHMDIISTGQFGTRIPVKTKDEFGLVLRNFNDMAENIEKLTLKLKQAQTDLIRSEKTALAGELAAEIAHEIRNPLNSIAANIELLKKYVKGNENAEKGQKHIDAVKDQINNLNLRVSAFLQAVAPLKAVLKKQDLMQTLWEAVSFSRPQCLNKNIKISLQDSPGKFVIEHDKELFYRAFLNLIKNSVESMPEGGEILIDVRAYENEVKIIFKDTGVGISPKEQKRIFDLYFTTKPQGSGIGLNFVLRTVEAHNGSVKVESYPGKGAQIIISLPR